MKKKTHCYVHSTLTLLIVPLSSIQKLRNYNTVTPKKLQNDAEEFEDESKVGITWSRGVERNLRMNRKSASRGHVVLKHTRYVYLIPEDIPLFILAT